MLFVVCLFVCCLCLFVVLVCCLLFMLVVCLLLLCLFACCCCCCCCVFRVCCFRAVLVGLFCFSCYFMFNVFVGWQLFVFVCLSVSLSVWLFFVCCCGVWLIAAVVVFDWRCLLFVVYVFVDCSCCAVCLMLLFALCICSFRGSLLFVFRSPFLAVLIVLFRLYCFWDRVQAAARVPRVAEGPSLRLSRNSWPPRLLVACLCLRGHSLTCMFRLLVCFSLF